MNFNLYKMSYPKTKIQNSNEVLDIVNEKDEVIGKDTFTNIHNKKLLHRATCMMVFRDKNFRRLAMQKRSKNIRAPGKFDFGGGHVKSGETYYETTIKEFYKEYLSNKVKPKIYPELILKRVKYTDNDPEIQAVYRVFYNGPFFPYNYEVEEIIEKDVQEWIRLSKEKPELFTEYVVLTLLEYEKKFLD